MSDARTANDDIGHLRRLAESGAHAPLLGGRYMMWWGLCLSAAYILHHLAMRGAIGDGSSVFGIVWLSFGIVGGVGQYALVRSMPAKAGSGSAGNRASRTIWFTAAAAILSMVIGCVVASQGSDYRVFDFIVPVAFGVYACALIVAGSLANDRISRIAGAGAVMMVGLYTAMIVSPDRYLIAAAGVFFTVLVPGLLLFLAEPRSRD